MTEIEVRATAYAAPDAQLLVDGLMADLARRYGDGDGTPVDPTQFDPPGGVFLVAYLDGEPVGCGGWRSHAGDESDAEVKRMFTAPAARGRGVARALLAALEESARERGRSRMILETGTAQPEAIALYEACGYTRIGDFGFYKDEPEVRSFGRVL